MKTRLAIPVRTIQVIDLYTYDTMIYIALLLNASISELGDLKPAKKLEDFTYEDRDMPRVLLNSRTKVSFFGSTVW